MDDLEQTVLDMQASLERERRSRARGDVLRDVLLISIVALLVLVVVTMDRAPRPSTVYRAPFTINREQSTVEPSAVDGEDAPFVASSIKHVYHLRICRYAKLMQHGVPYVTREAAEKDGNRPCSICLNETHVTLK